MKNEKSTAIFASGHGWHRWALACLSLVVALNLAAFAMRASFVSAAGPYAGTTGFEEFNLYHVWKAAHGLPVYEWPDREPYSIAHYNGVFYQVYAAWVRLWGATEADLVVCARWLTPLFGVLGMAVQAHLIRRMLRISAASAQWWVWGGAFLTWFGPTFGGWLVISVRSDVPAVALSLGGFALALAARENGRVSFWLASSLLFFAAWGFKQYVVWLFVGTVLQALMLGAGARAVAGLCGPFVMLTAVTLMWGGEIYRYSLITVPGFYRRWPPETLRLLLQATAFNLFFWAFGLVGWWTGWRQKFSSTPADADGRAALRWRATAVALVPPLLMGIMQITPPGSGINNMLEAFVIVALLGVACWLHVLARGERLPVLVGAALLLTMAPLTIVQLYFAGRGQPYAELRGVSVGNVIKLTPGQIEQRRKFAEWMKTLPPPVWTIDAMLQLPWFATRGAYPAYLYDYQFEQDAARLGKLPDEGLVGLIKARRFGALLLSHRALISEARAAGYEAAPVPDEFRTLPNAYGLDEAAPQLFVRSRSEQAAPPQAKR